MQETDKRLYIAKAFFHTNLVTHPDSLPTSSQASCFRTHSWATEISRVDPRCLWQCLQVQSSPTQTAEPPNPDLDACCFCTSWHRPRTSVNTKRENRLQSWTWALSTYTRASSGGTGGICLGTSNMAYGLDTGTAGVNILGQRSHRNWLCLGQAPLHLCFWIWRQ